jgi:hypothetical protein
MSDVVDEEPSTQTEQAAPEVSEVSEPVDFGALRRSQWEHPAGR